MRRNLLVAMGLAMAVAIAAATPASLAVSLLARLAKPPPASTPFVEVGYRGILDRPLVVSGSLHWLGGDRMERDVTRPYKATARLDGDELSLTRGNGEVQRVSLQRVPQAAAMLVGFRAMLTGDASALEREFDLSAEGGKQRWVITLVPRSDQLRRQLASIVIDGRDAEPRCLTVHHANGDSTITLLGAMATQGLRSAAPLQSALAARCRNP